MQLKRALFALVSLFAVTLAAQAFSRPAPPPKPKSKPPTAASGVSFQKDIVPIFRTACIGCHGGENPAGGLVLLSYADLIKGGRNGASIVAGKSAESRLVKMVVGTLQPKMPPGSGLKPADIERIRQWVDAGAKADAAADDARPKTANNTVRPMAKTKLASSAGKTPFHNTAPTPVTALAFSPDNKTLAVGIYREVQFWDVETQKLVRTWSGHADAVRALAFTKDGKWLAAGGGLSGATGEARIWDIAAGREISVLGEHTDTVNALAFSPDGKKLATGSADKSLKIWDLTTGKSLLTLREHSDAILGLAYSPDGKYIVTSSSDKSFKAWDATSGKRLYSVNGHDDVITDIEFSPDGKRLITSSADKAAKVWNFGTENSSLAMTLGGHSHVVYAATFASDGQEMATASADKSVKLWSSGGGNTRSLTDAKDWVYSVRFSPDRKRVAGGTWDGAVFLWNVADGKLLGQLVTVSSKK